PSRRAEQVDSEHPIPWLEAGGGPPRQGKRVEGCEHAEIEGQEDIPRSSPSPLQAGPAGRSPAAQGGRHHRGSREGDRLAAPLGARRHQRHAQEEARARGDLRQGGGSGSGLPGCCQAVTPRMRTSGCSPMGSDERYVSPYLLRPLRTLEEVLGGRGTAAETARGGVRVPATGGDQVPRGGSSMCPTPATD